MLVLALLLFVLAAAAAVLGGAATPLGEVLYCLAPGLLNMTQAGIQRHVSPGLWDNAALPLLEQPAWLVPLALGALLLLVRRLLAR